ncbi:hypothetical protein [Sediminimonas qiaohouensis]|uniref:hypothetical protein n=1 Tax=Sediminimonas qiaohouensis TaxID=552061 RepID=UPI00047D46CB|nr:hypothetical protein [Sediminimonas qiaohouensis]
MQPDRSGVWFGDPRRQLRLMRFKLLQFTDQAGRAEPLRDGVVKALHLPFRLGMLLFHALACANLGAAL